MSRELIFKRIIELCLVIILLRFFYLQVYNKDFYVDLSQRNYLKSMVLPAPRGLIYDRNNNVLAENKIVYSVYLIPPYKFDKEKVKNLAEILGLKMEDLQKIYSKISPYMPAYLLKRKLTPKEIILLEVSRDYLPSFTINMEFDRFYPYGSIASHIIGYMGEVSKDELENEELDYSLGEKSGKYGLEASYEKILRGKKGFRGISLYAYREKKIITAQKDPIPGRSIVSTIDIELQKVAEEALGEEKGVVIVSNPWTGEILALVSHPSFDPNKFIEGFTKKEWEELIKNPDNPLNNRAISSLYPPGSIFKLVVALSALENNKVSSEDRFYCPGEYKIGKYTFRCWKKGGHGHLDFIEGIAQSCNVVFFNVGLRIGDKSIEDYAKRFFLDSKTGIDIPGELKGFIPSREWKMERLREPWYPGDTLNLSIGQGYILVTPMEIHAMMSMIATEGILYKPHLVSKIIGMDGKEEVINPEVVGKVSISQNSWAVLKKGMKKVVDEGTGLATRIPGVNISGKTGTAENPHGESHAWFSCFFPSENPQYVVTVFVEHGKSGGGRAAPIAKKVIEYIVKGGVKN
ncbi:MAG: penicillin-binding protein 2 [Dictyoglomus sp.]|uniref:Penicillin-binding protein 2 n=1 Tax=Dictyoglomus turgidum (strain DSM 6724 / Z-1310) TaxID=515635 RepID=B8E0T8_DICTD|nr:MULTISPECIES: penicillin-binding protein 2 [Dictyoglomus]ACK42675.1 penicillin-binding protein 2 [Dictyoglomus turgidum DSM 6724]HBU30734.1 penicillin-binding protein 2 [Dictyoglomus sp.]